MIDVSNGQGRGFVLLWRAFWDDPDIKIHGPWPDILAWLFLFSNLANGIERNGIPRGEFEVSERYLAKRWLWSQAKVHRFLEMLQKTGKIKRSNRNPVSVNREVNREVNRFSICKYYIYQETRIAERIANRIKSKEGIKESKKKSIPASQVGDPAFELFSKLFKERFSAPYQNSKADFIQLAAIRKSLNIGSRDTPSDWEKACRNYLSSPMNSFSIAFMVTSNRYTVFRSSKLDRYGKPEFQESLPIQEPKQETEVVFREVNGKTVGFEQLKGNK